MSSTAAFAPSCKALERVQTFFCIYENQVVLLFLPFKSPTQTRLARLLAFMKS